VASPLNVCLCVVAATLLWTCLGFPVARHLAPGRPLSLAMAPVLGWAVFSPLALLVSLYVGFTRGSVALLVGVSLLASLVAAMMSKPTEPTPDREAPSLPWWAYAAAALLAGAAAIAVMPKFGDGGVFLAAPIFDHSKAAIIDDVVRLGLPAGNPFFGEAGEPSGLAYYYLWHFSAAIFALLLGVSGWEADIALTGFTAFASLMLMMGLAVSFSGHRAAALWVLLLSLAGSLRPVLQVVLGEQGLDHLLSPYSRLQTWMVQASWAPQHLISAMCVITAVFLMCRLALRSSALLVAVLALVVAAGFESSTWVGGVTFALAAGPVCCGLLVFLDPRRRRPFLIGAIAAAMLALVLAFPFIRDEYLATLGREAGLPVALQPLEVLGAWTPLAVRRVLDIPAYWLLLLLVEFPAIYIMGSLALVRTATSAAGPGQSARLAMALGLLAVACLAVGSLLVSTIGNNDLGWRGPLPGVMVLTVFAAVGLSRWRPSPRLGAAAAAIVLFLLGLPDGLRFIDENAMGNPTPSAAVFADAPELWRAVRRHSAPDQRVGNNPKSLADLTVWPINISWALFADRRSCYAGWALARAFVALPKADIDALETRFTRVFDGSGSQEDVHELATRYSCRLIVVTAQDGAWSRDPFAESADYRLAEEAPAKWRIYVATDH
jgi:hypothetical protein